MQQPTAGPWSSSPPRRSLARWWGAAVPLFIGAILSFVWFVIGGLPFTDHAAYGRVPVPGAAQLSLPEAQVYLSFEEDGVGSEDSADSPADLVVTVVGPTGASVPIERLSGSLYSINSDGTAREPYGRMDVPAAGTHQVVVDATPGNARAPRVTLGEAPWNPFGPPVVGALVILIPFLVLAVIVWLFVSALTRPRPQPTVPPAPPAPPDTMVRF